MKHFRKMSLLLCIFSLTLTSCATQKEIKKNIKHLEVDAVFQKVYDAVQDAVKKANPQKYEVESIDIEFGMTNTVSGNAGLTLFVVSGKYSHAYANAKAASFHFAPDPTSNKNVDKSAQQFRDYLAGVIEAAEKVNIKNNFALQEFSAEMGFTITQSGELSAEAEFSPATPSLGFSKESEYVHTITVNFKSKTK
jgi:hypothetical protein